jgi:mannose-6-phosphate isomerase-like protein (cupin superfamily)
MSAGAPHGPQTPLITDLTQLLSAHGSATYREFLRVPALSLGLFAVGPGHADTQDPHQRDEVYVVVEGRARSWWSAQPGTRCRPARSPTSRPASRTASST